MTNIGTGQRWAILDKNGDPLRDMAENGQEHFNVVESRTKIQKYVILQQKEDNPRSLYIMDQRLP